MARRIFNFWEVDMKDKWLLLVLIAIVALVGRLTAPTSPPHHKWTAVEELLYPGRLKLSTIETWTRIAARATFESDEFLVTCASNHTDPIWAVVGPRGSTLFRPPDSHRFPQAAQLLPILQAIRGSIQGEHVPRWLNLVPREGNSPLYSSVSIYFKDREGQPRIYSLLTYDLDVFDSLFEPATWYAPDPGGKSNMSEIPRPTPPT